MYISQIQIKNYMGFRKIPILSFVPGINLIVGQNNVGKSSLLTCLRMNFDSRPNRNVNQPVPDESPLDPLSEADFQIIVSGKEVKSIALAGGFGTIYIPKPPDMNLDSTTTGELMDSVFGASKLTLEFNMHSSAPNTPATHRATRFPCHGHFSIRERPKQQMLSIDIKPDRQTMTPGGLSNVSPIRDLLLQLVPHLQRRIYYFHAERLNVAKHTFGNRTELTPNASNLPEVLLSLHSSNPTLYDELIGKVRDVIPTVKWIAAKGISNSEIEIFVWPVPKQSQREDLAVSLNESGTGVGQVLAILYVVLTAKTPRVFLIDEPASFLHPGASRKLIAILQEFEHHQYIIATHSPEVIGFARTAATFLITSDDSESKVEQFDAVEADQAKRILLEVGARLSDVYGADSIIWVEGPTEEVCFPLIGKTFEIGDVGTIYRPVRDTGSILSRKKREGILDIYENLSGGKALIPPALAFVFDRESLSDSDIYDLEKRNVRVLRRRMYENYLLDADAITSVLGATNTFADGAKLDPDHISKLLEEEIAGNDLADVNGAEILASAHP